MKIKWLHSKYYHDINDLDLLDRYRGDRDQRWITVLFDRYLDLIFGLSMKYMKDRQVAEDASMEIFGILLDKAGTSEIRHFQAWLYQVTKNHCLAKLRKRQKLRIDAFDPAFMQKGDFLHPIYEDRYGEDDIEVREKLLHSCLAALPENQMLCVKMLYFEKLSYQEIANATGFTLGRVRSHIQNGRRNLKICMEKNDG